MTTYSPFRFSPLPLSKIQRNPRWYQSRALYWETRVIDMMSDPLPRDGMRNARLHTLLLRVHRIRAAADMAIYVAYDGLSWESADV